MRPSLVMLLLYASSLFAGESFISGDEYAKMLYKNPRGIGCDLCHGEMGEGKKIGSYDENGKRVVLYGPPINNLSMKQFYQALQKGNRLMPEYFLTAEEKAYLYYYLTTDKTQH